MVQYSMNKLDTSVKKEPVDHFAGNSRKRAERVGDTFIPSTLAFFTAKQNGCR
jgi:hypothetical protein